MRALVVDDELTSRILIEEILSAFADVDTCGDGDQAVLACHRALESDAAYDLICMDIIMPSMSGLEALRLIRREEEALGRFRPNAAKVVMTTVSGDPQTISEAFRESSDAYIVKPVDAEELIDIVQCLFPAEHLREVAG